MNLKSEVKKEIEQSIKNNKIDRKRFFEVSKLKYQEVINKAFFRFVNSTHNKNINLYQVYLRYNPKLKCIGIGRSNKSTDWWQWFKLLPKLINNLESSVYIIFSGQTYSWVYEGYVDEVIEILYRGSPIGEGDCYIISKKYDWLIGYSDDGDYITCVGSGLNINKLREHQELNINSK